MCEDAQFLLNESSRTICFLTSGLGSVVMICANGQLSVQQSAIKMQTFNANTVFPPLSIHLLTAPPAPSPRLPSSTILFSLAATFQPASSRSSTSSALPFSKLSFSRSGSIAPCMLPSRSIPVPPSPPADDAEYNEPAAESGSCELDWPPINPASEAEYEEAVVEVE